MKTIGSLLIALVLMAGMLSCGEIIDNGDGNGNGNGNGTVSHQLTVSSTAGGSVVEPGDGVHVYEEGTVVDLVAQPDTGHRFVSWTGDAGSVADVDAASTTITINGDYYITASFEEISEETPVVEYELTVDSTSGGEVTIPGEGTLTFDDGTVVELVAEADEGYEFVNWTGDVDTIADVDAASTTIIMDGDYAITANFEQILPFQYNLTISSTGGGTVTKPGEGTFAYDEGTVVSLSASPAGGYYFVNWTGGVATLANVNAASTTITVTDDLAIMANFSVIPVTYYTLTMAVSGSGSTSPAVGQHSYAEGTVVSTAATPAGGWQFANWTGNVGTVANVNAASTTITMNGNYSITANFLVIPPVQYTLTISSTAGGSVTTPGEGTFTYNAGTVVSLVATPASCYSFTNWTGNVGTIANVNAASTTITMNSDYSITANFAEEQPVYFPDPNLEAVIRNYINKYNEPICPSDLACVTHIHAPQRGISDLTGLESCTNLVSLYLLENPINDISPLASLSNLTQIYLEGTYMSHLSLSDISPLANLTKLTVLWLRFAPISDISPLDNLTNLRELYLLYNQISDISPLVNLTNLRHLWLVANPIGDVSSLANLTNLTQLWLDGTQISDVSILAGFTSLTELHLSGNQIGDISPLTSLTNLTVLYIDGNPISDISILAGLTGLTELRLDGDPIGEISVLSNLANLTILTLDNTQISDISPLANLTNLTVLFLRHNQITDISPLVENEGLGAGDRVWLGYNPLSEESINIYIPQLQARGVTVYY